MGELLKHRQSVTWFMTSPGQLSSRAGPAGAAAAHWLGGAGSEEN